jgi:integrase
MTAFMATALVLVMASTASRPSSRRVSSTLQVKAPCPATRESERKALLGFVRGKTGWREIEVGRGSSERTCPVAALETWIAFARLGDGPVFRPVSRDGKPVLADRLTDKHVARLVKTTALAAGVRADLPEGERRLRFAGHLLRAGLATAAKAGERHVQKQLGHSTAEMTRRYQRRRNRFRVNLTKTAEL